MEPHPTKMDRRHFKHQILSESNQNCKVTQNSQKRGTHEVSGHFDIIWPNFTSPTAEQQLPAATVSKTSKLLSEPTDGLRIPPKSCISNFRSFRQRLTQFRCSETKPSLPAAEHPGTMAPNSELVDHLKMTPASSLSNFRSIGHRLTKSQSSAFSLAMK